MMYKIPVCFLLPTETTVFLLRIFFCRYPKILASVVRGGPVVGHTEEYHLAVYLQFKFLSFVADPC